VIKSGRAIATFLNFYVSQGSTAVFSRDAENFVDNLLLSPTVYEFSKSVNR